MQDFEETTINVFDSRIMSSTHINFLFGAGVNGNAFPQMQGFTKSVELLEKEIGHVMDNFESDINTISSQKTKDKIYEEFIKEFKEFSSKINYKCGSINNISRLFSKINKLMIESENRNITMKQVNIYTLNYDVIVETMLQKLGLLINVISSSNIESHDKFFDLIGYNYNLKKYIPTYLISKIHGEIENAILPGMSKYDEVLAAKRFEILFQMKSHLSKTNSTLLIIGYSGKDNHINSLLKDCIVSGLTIYWFKYRDSDYIPRELEDNIIVIDQENQDKLQDTTEICAKMLENLWKNQLEE